MRPSGGEARCPQQGQQYRPGLNHHRYHHHHHHHHYCRHRHHHNNFIFIVIVPNGVFLAGSIWELFLPTGNVFQPSANRLNLKIFTFFCYLFWVYYLPLLDSRLNLKMFTLILYLLSFFANFLLFTVMYTSYLTKPNL